MRSDDEACKQTTSEPADSVPPDSDLSVLKSRLRWAQGSQLLAVRILELLQRQIQASDAIREILGMVKEFTGFEAVGIRLRDGDDFPYFETKGFPGYFVEAENSLCSRTETGEIVRDFTGNPVLECMCGNIICGRTDPSLPFFTEGGSFWSNCTTELLATTTDEERQTRTRNRCNGEGYESVALIPLPSDNEIIGLLQLNDSRKNCFTSEMIRFFEGVGVSIGIVLERTRVQQDRDRLFDLSIDMLCVAGFDGFFKQINPAFTKTLGWTKGELLSMPGIDLVQPEDREATAAAGGRLASGEPLYEFRNRCRHRDGSYRWVSWNMFPMPKEGLIFAVGRDVTKHMEFEEARRNAREELEKRVEERTSALREANEKLLLEISERKRAEAEIQKSEEHYRSLFENMLEGYAYCKMFFEDGKPQDFIYLAVNDSFERLTGLNNVIGRKVTEVIPGIRESNPELLEIYSRVALTGNAEKFETYVDSMGIWFSVSVYSSEREHFVAVFDNITDRKRAEDSLVQLSKFQQTLIDAIPNPVFFKDINRKYIGCNEAFGALLGLPKEEVVGRSVYEVVPKEVADMWNEKDQKLYDHPHVQSYDFNFIAGDGAERFFINRKAPFLAVDGSLAGLVGVMVDITDRKRAEAALRESEERYRVLVEESFDGLFLQKGTKLVFTNSRLREMLGYNEGELEGQDHWVVYHPAYREITRERAQARLRGEPVVSRYEVKLQRKDGSSFDCELLAKHIQVGGEPGIQAWFRDITERKRAEDALRESEEKYRASFNNAAVGIDLVDRDGRFLEVNETLSNFLGYTPEELQNLTILDVTHPEDVAKSADQYQAFLRGENEGYRLEKRYIRKDGGIVWADTSVSAILGRDGEYRATVGVIADITKRRKSEETARRLATAVEQAAEAIVITDTGGTILYVNPAFESTTGYSSGEALGKKPGILKSGHHDPAFYRSMWETLNSGRVWSGRLINKKKDGTLFEEEATISPITDDSGKTVSYVGVKRDVTKEVSLQRQLHEAQKMEAIGTLAGGIAHDFNNLLQVTLGYSELLLAETVQDDAAREDLQKIHQAALSGADLVQRLLTFSRKVEPRPVPMSLNKHIKDVEKLLSRTIPKMIDIRLELGDDTQRINADPALMEQVLMNLAVNARDAMPDGGGLTISTRNVTLDEGYCELHAEAMPGDYVLLSVSDTGQGMAEETIEHIFEPFYTTKELGRGTGLGLAMVYGIVRQHSGHITCQSQLRSGTTFKIYLPAIPAEAEPGASIEEQVLRRGTETILLVDDEEIIRELGKRILERWGYTVLTAANGREALDLYAEQRSKISLVILDLIMPEMGGKQCLGELLEIDPELKVVIASGYSPDQPARETIKAGAGGFIAKPYNLTEMLRTVREVLDRG